MAPGVHPSWAQGGEPCIQAATILQGLAQQRHEFGRNVEAAAAALVGESPEEGGMFVAAGTGRAMGSDTGFADLGKRPLESGPEGGELGGELLLERGVEA